MALMNELIHNNRHQLQSIRKINSRVQGECAIVTHKLKDRATFFQGQTRYFKRRGSVTLEEKTEAVNIKNSRNNQNTALGAFITALSASHKRKMRKWSNRCSNGQRALNKVNVAIRAVNEWSPKSSHAFIQQSIKETADLYKQVKNMPLSVPEEMIQLAASDRKLRKRLYQWLNHLKAAIVDTLAKCQRARTGVRRIFRHLRTVVGSLRAALLQDSKELGKAIENYTILIKVYSQNERIYSNLFDQNSILIQSNTRYCSTESSNFAAGQRAMESQLKVFISLRVWLRKNFHRVRRWITKKYSRVQ